jgi:hypothetical protein
MTLADMWKVIQAKGPHHILLNQAGDTKMTVLALRDDPDLHWDLVYIRNDGWSLGCSYYLGHHAEALHRADWIAVVRRGDKTPRPVQFTVDTVAVPVV